MSNLIIRDISTGESRVFTPTSNGYAEAEAFRQRILDQHHIVGDDNSGSLGRIGNFYSSNGNLGRPGKIKDWY